MGQVRIQALGTDMAVCILNFAPVPWQRENVSTEHVCDTFNDKWTVKSAQSLRQRVGNKKRANFTSFPLEYHSYLANENDW